MSFINDIFDVSSVPGRIAKSAEFVTNVATLGVSIDTNKKTKQVLTELDTIKYNLRETSTSCRRTAAGLDAAVNQFGAASKTKKSKKKSSKKEKTVAAAAAPAPEKKEEKKEEKKSSK